MSWIQSLRDEFTLTPFEVEHTRSDGAAMASGPPDVMADQEPAEVVEECSGKKKSKFQTFKKFFARKKRKEPPAAGADAGLKASRSSDNVSKTSQNNTLTRSEKGSGSKISLGSKALSHDSIFVSDSSEANEALGASHDSIHGKVKSLQLQLRQAIRLGSPPSLMCVKKTDDAGAMSEDDGLPCSPLEYTTLHTVTAQRNSSISLEGSDSDQLSCAASSGVVSPLVVPGDFSQPASPFGCLDNSAAKHKLGLRHKAGNRRKPRLEMKAEGDSVVEEMLNSSITEAAEERPSTPEVVSGEELKPTGNREEEEDKEEEEQPQHSRHSLLRDEEEEEEEREEGEDRSQAEQDVSHGPDSSSPPERRLSEEEAPDAQPRPSSKHSPRDSSLDSPRATPEPPAGPREYLLDPPGIAYGAEERGVESDLALSGEEDGVQDNGEEESSFLQEVLSSLKTPLSSCSLGMEPEGVVLEIEEEEDAKEKEREDIQVEEGEEVKEEEAAVEEPVGYQAAAAGSLLSDHTAEEEEEEEEEVATLSTPSCRDVEEDEEEEEAAEEEELVVEHVCQHDREADGETEEAEEVTPEEQDDVQTRNAVNQAEEERREEEEEEESEGEEEAIELEKEPEVEEEGREKREEVEEAEERLEEAEEAIEEEREAAEEMMETFHEAADEEVAMLPQEEDEGVDVVVGDDTVSVNDEETELGDEAAHQIRAASDRSFGEEREDGEEKVEEGLELSGAEQKSEQEEDESERDLQQEGAVASTEQANVSAKPPSLSLSGSHDETWSQESGAISPSKTGTTTIHINLLSPSSDKATPFFQQSPTATHPNESGTPGHAAAATEDEEPVDDVEAVEEEDQSALEGEAAPPASAGEEVNRPPSGSDQSKARFTIAPAWQRSLSAGEAGESLTPPSSPPAVTGPGGVEAETANSKDPEVEAEPASSAKAELVLSPGRVRSAGAAAAPPPSSVQPPTMAGTEGRDKESSVAAEGNPDSRFGVRLRKTSALHLFSSEEENTETPIEPPAQPTSCRVDSQQPISMKPSISQPLSIKPALPKKPDVHGDSGGKNKRMSDPAPVRGLSGSNAPSWISVAKQKQKIYKENSLDEITVKKPHDLLCTSVLLCHQEEQERKSSLPLYVSSAASREHSNRTAESTGKVSPLEISKHSASVDKDARRSLSPPTPVPPQPFKSQSLPYPVPPKPQLPPAAAKHPPQPIPPQRSPPVPVPQKSPSCTSPPAPSKVATSSKTPQPQSATPTSPPYSSRTAPEKFGSRAPGLSSQTPASQRGLPPPTLPQDEPPWMALAKKKAKAWKEMPQIVQ
ncbi:uncharacterized protein PEZ65_010957 isoform 2-T2 [Lycodopsis pacificus]